MSNIIPTKNETIYQPKCSLDDAYYWRGKDFPLSGEDTKKGDYSSPQGTVPQSERQRDASLNASGGIQNSPSIRGAEGRAFPTDDNKKESQDEAAVFAGERDPSLAVNRMTGQIQSEATYRVAPNNKQIDGKVQVRGRKAKADEKENKLGQ